MILLKINDDRSEIVPYNYCDFPVLAREETLSRYPGLSMTSHWHDDVEFVIVLTGAMQYYVNETIYILKRGQGLFVNSRQLHSGCAIDGQDCRFLCVLFPPALLCENERVRRSLIHPVTGNASGASFLIQQATPWQRALTEHLQQVLTLSQAEEAGFELHILSRLLCVWQMIFQHMATDTGGDSPPVDSKLDMLHRMIGFIQQNFQHSITLQDIAAAGSVSKSYCCAIFHELLRKTPVAYLCAYRLEKSTALLCDTTLSITETALMCGFSGSSYFAEIFHREMGCTPSQYRARHGAA